MQADPTPERSSRVLTPEPEPEPGPESVLDPEQDAQAALAEFAALHGPALRASGVPERYWGRLLHKLEHEVPVGRRAGRPGVQGGPGAPLGEPGCGPSRRTCSGPERAAGLGGSGLFYLGGCGQRSGSGQRTAGGGGGRRAVGIWRSGDGREGAFPGGLG